MMKRSGPNSTLRDILWLNIFDPLLFRRRAPLMNVLVGCAFGEGSGRWGEVEKLVGREAGRWLADICRPSRFVLIQDKCT